MTFPTSAFRTLVRSSGLVIPSLLFLAGCAKPFQAPVKDIEQITKTVSPQKAENPLPIVNRDPIKQNVVNPTLNNSPADGSADVTADAKSDVSNITEAALAAVKNHAPIVSLVMGPTFSNSSRRVACPAPYLESVSYMEGEGIKGWYNGGMIVSTLTRITEGRSINPRRQCEGRVAYLGPLGRVKLNTEQVIQNVAGLFHMDSKILQSMDESCADEVLKADDQATDAAWVRGYAVVAFVKKWAAFEDTLKIILSLRQQFDMQNPDSHLKAVNCEIFHSASLKTYCQGLATCLSPEQRAQAFESKAHTFFQLIDLRQSLKQQPASNEDVQKALAGIDSLPFLKAEAMAKYIDSLDRKAPDENAVRAAIKKELSSQQAKVDERLNTVNHGFDCLMGYTDEKCEDLESMYRGLMANSPQRIADPGLKSSNEEKDLGQISQLQSCMADWAGEVKTVSRPFNDIALLATYFLPTPEKYAAVARAGAALKTIAWAGAKALGVGAVKVGATWKISDDAVEQCNDLSAQLRQNADRFRAVLQNNTKPMSCVSSVEQFNLTETNDWCSLNYVSAILGGPMAKEAVAGLKSLRYLRSIPMPDFLSKFRFFGAKNAATAEKMFSTAEAAFASSKFYSAEAKALLEVDANRFTQMSELAKSVGLPSNATASEVKMALRKLQSKYFTDYQAGLSETDFNLLSAVRTKLNEINNAWRRIQAGTTAAATGSAPIQQQRA